MPDKEVLPTTIKDKKRRGKLPWLYRNHVVLANFILFYVSIVLLVVNVLVLCPCCFLAHFTLCCPTCQITPTLILFVICCSFFTLCIYQIMPTFDKKHMEKLHQQANLD